MSNQYGTKGWAKKTSQTLEVVLALLKEPDKQWDNQMTHKEAAVKSLNIIKLELDGK